MPDLSYLESSYWLYVRHTGHTCEILTVIVTIN